MELIVWKMSEVINNNYGLNNNFESLIVSENNTCNFADPLTDDVILCGQIIFNKNTWSILFQCGFCHKILQTLDIFLKHSLGHIFDLNLEDEKSQRITNLLKSKNLDREQSDGKTNVDKWLISNAYSIASIKTNDINIIDTCNDFQIVKGEYVEPLSPANPLYRDYEDTLLKTSTETRELDMNSSNISKISSIEQIPRPKDDTVINLNRHSDGKTNVDDIDCVTTNTDSIATIKTKDIIIKDTCDDFQILKGEYIERFSPANPLYNEESPPKNNTSKMELDMNYSNISKISSTGQIPRSKEKTVLEMSITAQLEKKNISNKNEQRKEETSIPFQKRRKEYQCTTCGKNFDNQRKFSYHLKNYHGKLREHKCDICDVEFKNRSKLEVHHLQHLGIPPYQCKQCEKRFNTKKYLKNHLRCHENVRKYKCDICDVGFKDSGNLNVHRMRHLGVQPHQCQQCEKRFTTTTELKIHLISHTGEKPFVCEKCGVSYSRSSKLLEHIKRHSNIRTHACEKCDMKFYTKQDLNDHSSKHSEERPFKCDVCNSTFKTKQTLQQHYQLHLNVFNYKCPYCDKAFQQRAGRHSHIKNVHGSLK